MTHRAVRIQTTDGIAAYVARENLVLRPTAVRRWFDAQVPESTQRFIEMQRRLAELNREGN